MSQEPLQEWSQQKLIQWVNGLNSIADSGKNQIIAGIESFRATGGDVIDADIDDLAESFTISSMLAGQLFRAINQLRQGQFRYRQPGAASYLSEGDATFSLNLTGKSGRLQRIDKLKASYTVSYLKDRYLESTGKKLNNENRAGVTLRKLNRKLKDKHTLKYYDIVNDTITLSVVFRVNGGATYTTITTLHASLQLLFGFATPKMTNKSAEVTEVHVTEEKDDQKYHIADDECRIRKLRPKKYKQIILSNEPDCIMHYTNKDGIKRAKMPCGCSFAADTMYRFMTAAFDKENNYRAVIMTCPMPRSQCKGSVKERIWDWSLVFMIADLSENEIVKYNQIISNRMDVLKTCPHCEVNCERPKDLTKFRVVCSNCKKSDWCWECRRLWKGCGYVVCGNDNCIAKRLNRILQSANMISEQKNENCGWAKNLRVPDIRHCPKCLTIIEYIKNCQHMTCSAGCGYEFCFKCLVSWKTKVHDKCEVAPIQEIK